MKKAPIEVRVALFTDSPIFAGTERHMFELARQLSPQVASLTVLCPGDSPLARGLLSEGLAVRSVNPIARVDRQVVTTLAQSLRSGDIDLIHAHNGRTALHATLAIRQARRGQCVFTQHFLKPDHATRRWPHSSMLRAAHCWMYRRIDQIIAVSVAAKQSMLGRREACESKITVIPNGIPDPAATNLQPEAAIRADLSVQQNAPLIVCVARLEREKDLPDLIHAMVGVHSALPDAVCVVAGDGDEYRALTGLIADLRLDDTVKLLRFREDVLSIIRAADLCVLPSRAEPFGLALIEAMALHKPVVATAAGGPMEIVIHNETGLLVSPGVPSELEKAIVGLFNAPEHRHEMGRMARARYEKLFASDRMAQATLGVYRSVVEQSLP